MYVLHCLRPLLRYRAIMQMIELVLRERRVDCPCKRQHRKKYASVMDDVRRKNFMLFWVVSGYISWIQLCFHVTRLQPGLLARAENRNNSSSYMSTWQKLNDWVFQPTTHVRADCEWVSYVHHTYRTQSNRRRTLILNRTLLSPILSKTWQTRDI